MKKFKKIKGIPKANDVNENSHVILCNTANYKAVINNSVCEILTKFVNIVTEYIKLFSKKIIMKKKTYYCFVLKRGFETLIHVFSVILYFTKNLELTFYHTQNACNFYIEFIEQLSDDNVTFLHLSSRDATIYVYKKTIFNLNNEYKKNIKEPSSEEKMILDMFNTYTQIYKSILFFIINHTDFKYENTIEYIDSAINEINFISETLNNHKIKLTHIENICLFITLLHDNNLGTSDFFKLLSDFNKKIISKKKFDEKVIKNKIYDLELSKFINNNELHKIVEWIFSD